MHEDVARADVALVLADDGLDRAVHRAEMHRHVRRVGDQRAVGGEHRAGEIEPLLDVDRIGGVLQRHAHLLGDRHEQVVEHFEHDRIGLGADRAWRACSCDDARQHEMVLRGDLGAPAGLDDDGLVRLDDDGRAGDLVAGRKLVAGVDRGVVPVAVGEESASCGRARGACVRVVLCLRSRNFAPPPTASTETASTTSCLLRSMKPKRALCAFSKARFHLGERAGLDDQRRVGAGVADVRADDAP